MKLATFVDETVERVAGTRADLGLIPAESARGALFAGAAGVAFFLYEAARMRGEAELLDRAREWCDVAIEWGEHASRDDWKGLPRGFILGRAGVDYVDALLGARCGEVRRVDDAVARIDRASERFDDLAPGFRPTELLGGAAGIVCLTRDLLARIRGSEFAAAREHLARIRDRAASEVLPSYTEPLALAEGVKLGMAHGVAGELWALSGQLGSEHPTVRARLRELAAAREEDSEGLSFWLTTFGGEIDMLIGSWCGGMVGHTLLWCVRAELAKGDEAALNVARAAAEATSAIATASPTLCCGLAGQSAVLTRYGKLAKDPRFVRRGHERLTRAIKNASRDDDWSFAFFQGRLGIAHVAMARLAGETMFPCVEPLSDAS